MLSSSLPAAWSLLGVGSGLGVGGSGPSSRGLSEGPGSTLVVKVISTVVACNARNPSDFTTPHSHSNRLCYSCAELSSPFPWISQLPEQMPPMAAFPTVKAWAFFSGQSHLSLRPPGPGRPGAAVLSVFFRLYRSERNAKFSHLMDATRQAKCRESLQL